MGGGRPEERPERGSPSDSALAAAEVAVAGGSPGSCLALLSALPAAQRQGLPARRLQALCDIQLAGRAGASPSWWQAFGLEAYGATPADVRRQYRRLAALVHPDKCGVAEVRQRQAALLAPPCDASGRRVPLPQLQARLRCARTTLADRVAAEAAAEAAVGGGGFLP
ncbi:dnaJ-like protein subfamily C member 8-like isoform X2 [Micractinium conductrix]|uniref:DnaJ-like protein subfamily C member 8-like isoform X2 n=1 Tax=Micractinium conductrix TaxID=554055 RepID=A0A2P6VNX7_9CHLO|nr:dnaJ-like protein subfamily C member 8-like isoform X2 [Micractinium conductrix]|eukprot:PSC75769.1 dnaJ-like protein subfamily C member 8-like isoform X2 [Micractinium conductrix]